jgi:transcriptional regulator with XRE-family HTH domain
MRQARFERRVASGQPPRVDRRGIIRTSNSVHVSLLPDVIRAYMRAHGLTKHEEMARVLGVDRTLVSKYLSGARDCRDVLQLRHFAQAMDLPPETFGLMELAQSMPVDPADTVADWRLVRRTLNRNRHELTATAARLYWDSVPIEGTTCITRPNWMAPMPLDLDLIRLEFDADAPPPICDGTEVESELHRPMRPNGLSRYTRYSQAVRAIARPTLFENRMSYRLPEPGRRPVRSQASADPAEYQHPDHPAGAGGRHLLPPSSRFEPGNAGRTDTHHSCGCVPAGCDRSGERGT